MNEHVENKLRGWASLLISHGWIMGILIFIAFFGLFMNTENLLLLIVGIAVASDYVGIGYFFARLVSSFADITENTRGTNQELHQLNINLQKVYSDDISAADRAQAEKERLEREQAEHDRREAERKRAEREQEIARRKEAYWQAPAAEKEVLLAKRAEAEKALTVKGIADKERQELKLLILRIDEELERER